MANTQLGARDREEGRGTRVLGQVSSRAGSARSSGEYMCGFQFGTSQGHSDQTLDFAVVAQKQTAIDST